MRVSFVRCLTRSRKGRYNILCPRLLTRLKSENLLVYPRADQSEDRKYTIGGTPIRNYSLERDDFSMIVPHGALGVVPESSSLIVQANKRRKKTKILRDSLNELEDLPITLSP
jgi:hypothetical protein